MAMYEKRGLGLCLITIHKSVVMIIDCPVTPKRKAYFFKENLYDGENMIRKTKQVGLLDDLYVPKLIQSHDLVALPKPKKDSLSGT